MKNLILTLIITLPITLWGQGWEQMYGEFESNDSGWSVQQTSDGGYIITGSIRVPGNPQSHFVFLMKTNFDGTEEWSENWEVGSDDYSRSVHQTTDGGYVITGQSDWGQSDTWYQYLFLKKTDENGNELWTKTFEVHGGYSSKTSDGGFIITGRSGGDVYLMKTDENGNELWIKTYGGQETDRGNSVQQTNDGGYIITGYTRSFGNGTTRVYLIKTDGNGNEQWSQTYGSENTEIGRSVKQTNDGGYIITGNEEYNDDNDNYFSYIVLRKTDGNGNEQWSQTFGGEVVTSDYLEGDRGYSVQQTQDGGYIITGSKSQDVYLLKTDGDGNEQWSQTFGGTDSDVGYSVQQTLDGGYIITGQTPQSDSYRYDIYLIKTDDQGNITSTFEIPLPNPNRKLEKTVNLKGQEVKPQTGQPIIEIFDDGSVEKKIVVE